MRLLKDKADLGATTGAINKLQTTAMVINNFLNNRETKSSALLSGRHIGFGQTLAVRLW